MIKIVFEKEKNRSAAYDEDKNIGVCEFKVSGNNWTITHTGVDTNYGGQGIAKKLVMAVKEEADRENINIIPVCSYAVKVLQ